MNNNDTLLIDNQYFPCINWFKKSINYSNIELSLNERWQKMRFSNRCVVAGSNGLINLSVPIQNGRNQKMSFKDIRIANDINWQVQHWRTIFSCYGKSPFFEFYQDSLRPFFEKKYLYLFDLNFEIICTLNNYINNSQLVSRVNDKLKIELSAQLNYCSPSDFQQEEFPLIYTQLFENRIGFQPNLSLLDLLFMEGPNTKNLLIN
ncbi:WbqC family protein [Arachidicoccus soli]|uniref:WbqC family protein n=1 Tax=Arachidicoccus soli TaxID=2341117 RepID=A0A386HN89_9BACT|nr:WbqC family protein [Arachidicoccus soli]AYD46804.1 hypothetical protein D6B99_03760 [Arachidicoccus soli]